MASAGGGAAGEGEWLKVAELRAAVQAQDPRAKVRDDEPNPSISLLQRRLRLICLLAAASSITYCTLDFLLFCSLHVMDWCALRFCFNPWIQ